MWDPLTALFAFGNKAPLFLEKFFVSEKSLTVLQFLQSVLAVFEKPLLQLQVSILIYSVNILYPLLSEIDCPPSGTRPNRRLVQTEDCGAEGKEILRSGDCDFSRALGCRCERKTEHVFPGWFSFLLCLCDSFLQDFYTTVIEYIEKWFHVEFLPTHISWITLKAKSIDYDEAVELAKQVAPEIAENDELFNEVVEVNRMLRQIPDEVFDVDSAEAKWQKIFKVSKNFKKDF